MDYEYFYHALPSGHQVGNNGLGMAAVAKLSVLVCAASVHVQGTWELGRERPRILEHGMAGDSLLEVMDTTEI